MKIEHFLVCRLCKEYINLGPALMFRIICSLDRPSPGVPGPFLSYITDGDLFLEGGYWESRGLWFLWNHRTHQNTEIWRSNHVDWQDFAGTLKEIYPAEVDKNLQMRLLE